MSAENQDSSLGWFLAGLGLGALVGVLFAPKSGRETRETLVASAKDGTEFVRVRAREAVDQVGPIVDRTKAQANEYVQRSKEAVGQSRAQWEEFVEKGKGFVADQTTRVTAAVEAGKQAYQSSNEPSAESFT